MRGAIFVAVLAGFVLPAYSQNDDSVVVNATRFPEDARRLPASTTVITADEIRNSAARTLPELLQEQVGITMKDFYGNNASLTSIDLRGYGVTGPQNTLILLDGRRVSDIDLAGVQWAAVPLAGIERIEILRGTGAVLYGDGASAGVVNIVTRSPLKQGPALEAFGRAATFNTIEGQLYGSHASGTFGINVSVYGFASDGYRANNRNEQHNTTASLRWGLGNTTLDLRAATDSQDLRLPGARRIQASIGLNEYAADRRGAQTPLDYSSRDGRRIGLALGHRVGEAELNLGLDWRGKDQRSYFDQAGFPIYRADALEVSSLTPRLRLPFSTGSAGHRLTLGADFHSWRYDSKRSNRPENAAQPINRVRASQDSQALYFQDLIDISRATQMTLGWRSERVRYAASDTLDPAAPGFFFNTAAPDARRSHRQRAWELGLRHAFSPAWSAFGRAGRSFRFVNVDELYENDAFFNAQFQILRPQHALTHEAGAEWRRSGSFMRATFFHTEVRDEIHLDPFSTGVGNTNLPPSRRQGVELEGNWQATGQLRMRAGYAYTEAKFVDGVLSGSPFAIGTNLSVAGKDVPLVPRHKLNAGFAWSISGATQLSGMLTSVSSQFMDNDEPNTLNVKIPRYAIVDLKLAHDFHWGRMALSVNNLLGSDYYSYAVRSAFIADRYAVYPLPGRTIGVSAELKL
ncbi:MAG: TonB-dependent receptor [Candidatus Parcubacteria bacterium]|nr:TonB-dependent receptor [Burkholderiales bacterium]